MSQYDLTNEEILRNFEEVGRDPVQLWRLAVAHTSRAEMHSGLIHNRHSQQFDESVYQDQVGAP
jgi:hypothetical protein